MDEIDPLLQVAHRHAQLYLLGGIAQSHAPFAKLVDDHQLLEASRIHERHIRKVDERWPSRSQTSAQGVLKGFLTSNVEFPRELDQYGSISAPVARCCFRYRRVALYGATSVGLRRSRKPLPCHLRSSRRETTPASGFCDNLLG